ncbi:translation initiation factor eIF-2B subunit alpha [Sporothrix schenckii 1099-18]|uniref:Translation initiation factor eIF2B subunit alpha n=1 Tax=Sporothrix schenckii 1099-18 TaxID=1397361 RepID=A0A0F2M7Y7_SPOSC|nr:translation initiation factor eIF-2B subunit alpha [Sporothrix schenckii 1099-18]KJR85808.1 translation initiation factor eIF-2B subunit alpha [Sporothrix schenckii 1099-18]
MLPSVRHLAALPPFSIRFFVAHFGVRTMAASDAAAPAPAAETEKSSTTTTTTASTSNAASQPEAGPGDTYDVVATYHRLLAEDADLTKPIAAIEALIDVLRQTTSSTAMETYEIASAQVKRLLAAVPNALPLEAGTSLFTNFLSMSMRQPAVDDAAARSVTAGLDSFDKLRQHLLDNSQLFVQRAKEARDQIAERGCRLVREGDVVLTAGGSRAVLALFLKAAERLTLGAAGAERDAPFSVLYVCDERSRDEAQRAMARLRAHRIPVFEVDYGSVGYAIEAHGVRSVFVGAEAVTHDGKLVSRIGTYPLAVLAAAARPACNVYCLAETHKFVHKLLINNKHLNRIGIVQDILPRPVPTRAGVPVTTKPPMPYNEQVDVTPPTLVTNFVTENGIIETSGAYRIVSY